MVPREPRADRVALRGPNWRALTREGVSISVRGNDVVLEDLYRAFRNSDVQRLGNILARSTKSFAVVVQGEGRLLAAVDRVRGFPLFYRAVNGHFEITDSPWELKPRAEPDRDGLLELALAGYATGPRTALARVSQLQPGELLFAGADGGHTYRYDVYRCVPTERAAESEVVDRIRAVMDVIFDDLVTTAAGRAIVVPLSGGFDSRLVLAHLRTRNYEPLIAFSYGPPGNHEAQLAQQVAEVLRVTWRFLPSPGGRRARAAFRDPRRVAYWRYADGASSIPVMTEYQGFTSALDVGMIPSDAIVVNGQSGDFITGGHVPEPLYRADKPLRTLLYDAIVSKHYSLWSHLKTPSNLDRVHALIDSVLPEDPYDGDTDALCSQYERWEFQERQSKYVINQQRLYEFLGLEWELPLWDGRMIDLFSKVPYDLKLGQRAFISYLHRCDPGGVFRRFDRATWRWRPAMRWVVPTARAIGVIGGRGRKEAFYRRMRYLGGESNQYAMLGPRRYQTWVGDMRNPVAGFARFWFEEHALEWPSTNP